MAERARATCSRCGAVLYRHKRNSIERTLALTIAALLLYVVANSYPLLTFDLKGDTTQATLISGVQLLYESHKPFVATVVLLTSIVAPGLQIAALLYVFVPLYLDRTPWRLDHVFRALQRVHPWSMLEVFMLGILVSVVKLIKLAAIHPGPALWSFAGLIIVMAGVSAVLDPVEVWKRLEQKS